MKTAQGKRRHVKPVYFRTGSMQKEEQNTPTKIGTKRGRVVSMSEPGVPTIQVTDLSRAAWRNAAPDEDSKKAVTDRTEEASTTANATLDFTRCKAHYNNRSSSSKPYPEKLFLRSQMNISQPGTQQFALVGSPLPPPLLYSTPRGRRRQGRKSLRNSLSPMAMRETPIASPWHRFQCSLLSPADVPAQHGLEKERIEEYFAKKKELKAKYDGMMNMLKDEERSAIELVLAKTGEGHPLKARIEEVKSEYSTTMNLLLQQQILEEEELLKVYNETLESAN